MIHDRKKSIIHNIKQGLSPLIKAVAKLAIETVIVQTVWNFILINHAPIQPMSFMNMIFLIISFRIALGHININIENTKKLK